VTVGGGAVAATVEEFALLVGAAALIALVARRFAIQYTLALVLFGLGVALVSPGIGLQITPELVLLVLLPGLVFEAAYQIDVRELRRSFGWVVVLAAPGVVISATVVALVLNLATGLPLDLAFVVGAMVSATDPAAVVATFKRLRSPARLRTLVDAESLFNDGTAIVVFAIAIRAVSHPLQPGEAVVAFAGAVIVSACIGAAFGVVASRVIARVDDHLIELTISLVLAYGTYLVADRAGQSGIIATVVAGIVLGSYGRQIGLSAKARAALDTVWEFIAFILTAIVFLLIGLVIRLGDLTAASLAIAWGVVAILVGRALVVYVLLGIPARLLHTRRGAPAIPLPWLHVMFWGGLRGAVAVALVLSLPETLPQRSLIEGITFGIVLFTLVVQGTTVDALVRRSGVGTHDPAGRAEAGGSAAGEDEPPRDDPAAS
jgi:CPA1 family monovalent cation:H+ antiporter